jgi:hypothetical protein
MHAHARTNPQCCHCLDSTESIELVAILLPVFHQMLDTPAGVANFVDSGGHQTIVSLVSELLQGCSVVPSDVADLCHDILTTVAKHQPQVRITIAPTIARLDAIAL